MGIQTELPERKSLDPKEKYQRELRAIFARHELKKVAKEHANGPVIFLRTLLAVLFMGVVLSASELFGITGTILISVLFLTVYFIPMFTRKFIAMWKGRKLRKQSKDGRPETETNGNI